LSRNSYLPPRTPFSEIVVTMAKRLTCLLAAFSESALNSIKGCCRFANMLHAVPQRRLTMADGRRAALHGARETL
jgi:hypothetical protein